MDLEWGRTRELIELDCCLPFPGAAGVSATCGEVFE